VEEKHKRKTILGLASNEEDEKAAH